MLAFLAACSHPVDPEIAPAPPAALAPPANAPEEPVPEPSAVADPVPAEPAPALPTWDEAVAVRPGVGTDRPRPVLIVTPAGACYLRWVSPMARPPVGDHVEDCASDCGIAVVCPEKAAALRPPATP